MIKRPISPSDELPTTTPPLPNSHFASLRRAVQGRSNSFPTSARAVCVLLAALCLVFFFAETSETKSVQTTTAVSSSGPRAEAVEPTKGDATAGEEALPPVPRGGLRRFESFKEYVEASRAEGGGSSSLPMPVVEINGRDVTVPSVIIIGAQRAGTSALFSMLSQHPGVGAIEPEPVRKNDRGFMTQDPQSYPREAEWPGDKLEMDLPAEVLGGLLEQVARPYTEAESRREGSDAPDLVTIGLNPGYFASPLAPYRLKLAFPDAKIVVVLRDPTDRYYSEMRQILCADEGDVDWEDISASFAMPSASKDYLSRAVLNYSPYDKTCLGEGASAADLWGCQTAMLMSHRPLLEGMYSSQLRRWWRAFDDSQVHVVKSDRLFEEPEKVAAEVAKFAGLGDDHAFFEFALHREASCDPRRRSSEVSTAFSKRKESEPQLRKWYTDHNDMLSELIGEEMGWNDRIRSAYTRSPPS
ncbi:unnamed protein product [Scytosiphon promiscuus]